MRKAFLITMAGMVMLAWAQGAAPPAKKNPDAIFKSLVLPVLSEHCLRCHGTDRIRGGLDLRTIASIRAGGDSGPILVPGKSKESLLLQLLTPKGKPHMPPRKQLSDGHIATLTKWIDAMPPEAVARTFNEKERNHWSFQKLGGAGLPGLKDDWIHNGVDAFILQSLRAKGLEPSPEAERIDLLRRVYFDLIGLPPTPAELDQAMSDRSADWYEKVVDKLLASPRYGERWGRHWLDLARYADSGGFHNDLDRPNAWRYRDYVIKSLNEDKPFGRFVREQLAGDEIAPDDPEALAATAFCRNGPSNEDNMGQDREKYRLDELDDVISTTGAVFLGLTLGCARCHDHKFDPVTLQDYYRFLAIFNSTVNKDVPLDPNMKLPAKKKGKPKVPAIMVVTENGPKPRTTRLLWRGDLNNPGPEVEPGVPVILSDKPIAFPEPTKTAKTTGRRRALADWIASPENPLTWRVLANRLWQHHFGRGLVASSSNFGLGGDRPTHPALLDWLARELLKHDGRLKPVHRTIVLSSTYRQSSQVSPRPQGVDPDNKLLWRAPKRRLEAELIRDRILFAAGNLNLKMGGPGIKPRIHPSLLIDSQRNKWPLVKKEGPEHWRRSVYVYIKRQLQLPLLELFDAPTSTQSCNRRDESTVPTQALALMNDDFTQDQSGYFARRVLKEAGNDLDQQAKKALELALSGPPRPGRIKDAVAFLEQQRKMHASAGCSVDEANERAVADLGHVLFNCNEFIYID